MRRLVVMRTLGLMTLALVACGDRAPAPNAPATGSGSPSAAVPGQAAAAPRHAAPTCPLAALGSAAGSGDDDAPREGIEGEGRIDKPARASDTCGTADSNLQRAEAAIATASTPAAAKSKPWDHKRKPEYSSLVDRRLDLQAGEKQKLDANGFVVLGRYTFHNYATAFHEIYQSQLPVYVSIDAVLHAIYSGNDSLIADLEDQKLRGTLDQLVDTLSCALPGAAADYPADTARDLDLYLAVARSLLRGDDAVSMFGDSSVETEARALVERAVAADEMDTTGGVELFGRKRVIDFTAYTPRGHYGATDARKAYFRASMWLSRIELNLVSRSSRSSQPGDAPDPSETPREDVDALALADLIERTNTLPAVAQLDTAWALLAGNREDVSAAELIELRHAAGIAKLTDADVAAKLRGAIGDHFQRTAQIHYMPAGSTKLPAIATLLGPRVVGDAAATRPIVNSAVPDRTRLSAVDMAYVLGHDRAKTYLASDLAKFPNLGKQLDVARDTLVHAPRGTGDLYSAWLNAVEALGDRRDGTWPSFASTDAFADYRIGQTVAAFGQIKHNYVLIAGESYFEGGCAIPDGYVEPAPGTYKWLLDYAARGAAAMAVLDPDGALGGAAYFKQLGVVVGTLARIQSDELAGAALTADERAFLSMVSEMEPGTTGGPPTYTGWWFDLFRHRELDGLAPNDFIASFFTGDTIAYAGETEPELGVFVVDVGGAPRLTVGPVATAYEYQGPVAKRVDDAAAKDLPAAERAAPWAASYAVAASPEPRMLVKWWPSNGDKALTVQTDAKLGKVTIEPFDHHRVAMRSETKTVKPGTTSFAIRHEDGDGMEGVHVKVASAGFDGWYELGEVEEGVEVTTGGFAAAGSGDAP